MATRLNTHYHYYYYYYYYYYYISSDRQHLSYDVCLEVRGEIITELFCVVLCTVVHSHNHT